jgi:hypothetical protein
VKNAYEWKEHYGKDGKCISRERAVGPIVPWSIVVLAGMLLGQVFKIPSGFWQLFKL